MTLSLTDLTTRLAGYLSERNSAPTAITDIARIPGGASRETYRLTATVSTTAALSTTASLSTTAALGGKAHDMILRIDPESSLIDTDRATEFAAYSAAFRSGVIPVPEPLVLEENKAHLGQPFTLMAEIRGCQTSALALPPAHIAKIADQKWSILGRLAALDVDAIGISHDLPKPQLHECALREVDYWAGVISKDAMYPQPIAEAAIRWLRRNEPPSPAKLALVHGDYRTGNFLFDDNGVIRGILDWEMAHLGNPLEDLAWSLDPLWSWPDKQLAGRLIPRLEAIAIFERASGMTVDLEVFHWWEVFASLKAVGIWVSSTEDFEHGKTKEPILAMAGWLMTDRQNRILVDRLAPNSPRQYTEQLSAQRLLSK